MQKKERLILSSVGFELTKLQIIEDMVRTDNETYPSKNFVVRLAIDEFLARRGKIKPQSKRS